MSRTIKKITSVSPPVNSTIYTCPAGKIAKIEIVGFSAYNPNNNDVGIQIGASYAIVLQITATTLPFPNMRESAGYIFKEKTYYLSSSESIKNLHSGIRSLELLIIEETI